MGKVIETVADSIAIEILHKNVLLLGKGNELHLYGRNTADENVFDVQVLPISLTNKVHGIKKLENSCDKVLLAYGEKEFVLIEYTDDFKFYEFYRAELSDWICCGLFLNYSKEIVLLTAHSIILRFAYQIAEGKCLLKERVTCTDKSTLYCGHLLGKHWNELVVFGGNAFGELLIWQPVQQVENQELSKHKVSPLIHRVAAHNGVIFSIDYEQKSQCLITSSDDRSIKWWKVELKHQAVWKDSSLQPLSSGYGHIARVFQGRIINKDSHVYGLSVGEDSYFCVWNRSGQLLFKRRHQYGAVIWNFAYDQETTTIYTIGSTGNLVAFDLKEIFNEAENPKGDFLLPTVSDKSCAEYIAKVKFLNESHLVALTNHNNLLTLKYDGQKWLNWERSTVKLDFKATVMAVYENLVAICGYRRLVLLERQDNSEDFVILYNGKILEGVLRTFVFFNKQQFLVCNERGSCIIFTRSFETKRCLELPKCKEPWLTTALLLKQQQHIVVSNRQGNLLLYQQTADADNYELKDIVKHPHGNLGATHLLCLEESSAEAVIKSTGHDGALNLVSVDLVKNRMQPSSRQSVAVAWVESIERCKDLDLLLGFNDNHFVVWCKHFDFLLQIPCGGGHRCWSFIVNQTTASISLVFIKNKRVRFYKKPLFNKKLTALPWAKRWHVAPCNAMEILPQSSAVPLQIAVTAGEDNLLKIHTFDKQSGLQEQTELQTHISNIRCIKLKALNSNEFLIFSGGGRAQLCINKVNSTNFHLHELINYTLKTETQRDLKTSTYNFNPETRLMSLDVKVLNPDKYEIYVGCSDGFIRHLALDLKKMDISLLAQYFYGKCILQMKYLAATDLILVAATDGCLSFFDSSLTKCLSQLQLHSSGINGLAVFYDILLKRLHILSGGDDQAVSYRQLSLENLDFKVIKQFQRPYLHTAQVCACALSSNGLYGFTSGVDQVLNKIDLSTGEIMDSFYSCIADIKGLALIDDDVCLLYGCGLQIYAFNS